ncbi:MAG: MHYT domain-containing protein, partial [Janthinobacterium lividum]
MSILASWVALDLSARVHLKTRKSRKAFWLALGSGAMGLGIWSMHYIGMLAFQMQVPVLYDWPTVVLSLVVALAASAIALILVARKTLSWSNTVLGGTVMGAAIASMHYIGMSAMRMSTALSYSKPMVALSVTLAVGISMVALRLTFGSKKLTFGWSGKKASSAFLMGLAIPTMHYTGMAAVHMTTTPGRLSVVDLQHAISTTEVGTTAIILISLLVLGVALILARIDGHVSTFQSALDGSKRSYTQLQQHHERLQGAFRAGGFGLWECDPATGVFYVTAALRDLYGIPQDDQPVPRERWKTAVHPDDLAALDQRWAECMASGDKYENEYRILVGPDHQVRRVRSVASLVRNLEGAVTRVLGMTWEVTSERLREEEQRDQATRFRLTLNAIGDAVIATDDQMRVIFINPAASELTGWEIDAAVNSPIEAVFRAEDEQTGAPRPNPIQRCIEHGGSFLAEDAVLISRSGERYNIRKHVVLMGMGRAAVITFQNITAARRLEKQLLYAATHDSLTKLVNRTTFEKRLNSLWEENRYSGRTHCVCIVDLDRFK